MTLIGVDLRFQRFFLLQQIVLCANKSAFSGPVLTCHLKMQFDNNYYRLCLWFIICRTINSLKLFLAFSICLEYRIHFSGIFRFLIPI